MPYHSQPNMKLTTAASTIANRLRPAKCMGFLRYGFFGEAIR
jgi:hypothetical protein